MQILRAIALGLGVLFVLVIIQLGRLDKAGPAHNSLMLAGDEPATFYLPGTNNPFYQQFARPAAERPAAIVLVHGYMADRLMMSVLARRLAENGYAVLAIDLRGHGRNRNTFANDFVAAGALDDDVKQAVEFLRGSQLVDGSRIAVMGHSMGAGAVLDYATHDPALKAAVMISGGWTLAGPQRPRNALFIFAQQDSKEGIQQPSAALAAHLAGAEKIELGKAYGDFAQGNAVEAVQVAGVGHLGIIYSADAASTIVKWLDSAFATPRSGAIEVSDPRVGFSRLALLLFLILLVPIGRIAGSMAPAWSDRPHESAAWIGLPILLAALFIAMPLVSIVTPISFVPLAVGDLQVSWFLAAGLLAIAALTFLNRLDWFEVRRDWRRVLFAAGLGFAAIYFSLVPMAVAFHRLTFTPERFATWIIAAILMIPFWLVFELMLRRGSVAFSTLVSAMGRILILVMTLAGVLLNMLPFVLILILPILALIFLMMEIFAASVYSVSRNLLLIAIVESAWLAWTMAATNPIMFKF